MSKFRSNATTGATCDFAQLSMRTPPAIPNPLQASRNDIRLSLGLGEGNHNVIGPALLPEVDPIDREHIAHGFDVGCLLGVGPQDGEILLFVHARNFVHLP